MEGFTVLSQISNEVLVAVAVGLLVVLLAFFFVFKLAFPSRGTTILLTGPSDSGKTVLFFQVQAPPSSFSTAAPCSVRLL